MGSEYVLEQLYKYSELSEIDNCFPYIVLYNKSAYIISENIKGKIEFLDRGFEQIIGIPFGEKFEDAEIIDNTIIKSISEINKITRLYCDNLFYINKKNLINFIDKNYSSPAKIKKINLTIETSSNVLFNFKPNKKSVSVSESNYIIKSPVKICPNFRLNFNKIEIFTLLFYKVIKNNLFNNCVRIEINTDKLLRISCFSSGVKIKFVFNGKKFNT